LLADNRSSRPSHVQGWAQYRAWHPFSISSSRSTPRDALCVSDTGSLINELCYGLDGAGKPDTSAGWVRTVREVGCPVAGFYHFRHREHDNQIIKALGRA